LPRRNATEVFAKPGLDLLPMIASETVILADAEPIEREGLDDDAHAVETVRPPPLRAESHANERTSALGIIDCH
jgi:hypothetical protein